MLKITIIGAGNVGSHAAIQAASKGLGDIILLDLRMPNMGGLDVLPILRKDLPSIPVVMLTTSNDESDLIKALRTGAQGYLLKDMEPDELVGALRDIENVIEHEDLAVDIGADILKLDGALALLEVDLITAISGSISSLATMGPALGDLAGFADANGDGQGDFRGAIGKLDHIKSLGVDCIWVMPMYPSPLKDDGYDVADYYDIHPDFGTLDDFKVFLDAAHERGLKVITDLVMNHTSSEHPWFQEARKDPHSPYRDYYVWSDTDEKYQETRIRAGARASRPRGRPPPGPA